MRKLLVLLLCGLELLLFAGPNGLRRNFREVEQLLVIQTMGLDKAGGGVTLSLAAAGDEQRGVARLKADGVSVSAAMDRIRGYSYEQELFCPHIGRLLLGEKAAEQGIESALAYICRSPDLRLDMPLFVVRDGTAEEAVLSVGTGKRGICDVMQIVEQDIRRRGESGLTPASRVLRDTARCGSALICALDLGKASEQTAESEGESEDLSVAPLGYAILREGRLCRYLNREEGIAVGFLRNEVGRSTVTLKDRRGNDAVLEITGGSSRIRPLWEGDTLRGIEVQADARANLLELGGRSALKGTEDTDYLTAKLEAELAGYLSAALQASKELKADFLCLAEQAERANPSAFRARDREFVDLLPELELEITVSARLSEMSDMK
jgi:Spore germination B3/ GerAC like, C-terminal.